MGNDSRGLGYLRNVQFAGDTYVCAIAWKIEKTSVGRAASNAYTRPIGEVTL